MSETLSQAPMPTTFASSLARKRLQILALVAMSGIYFLSYFHRVAVPGTIFNQIQSDMALSASSVTALAAIMLYTYAGVQLFVGLCADRFGGVRVLVSGGLVMAAGAILFPLCHSAPTLYFCRALTGFGAGFMYLSILREVSIMFGPRRFPMLIAMVGGVGFLGGMAATLPMERATMLISWRMALLAVGGLTLFSVLLAAGVIKKLGLPRTRGAALSLRPIGEILSNRRCWPLLVCNVINFPVYFVIQTTVGKKFLEDFGGLSSATSASMTMIMLATGGATTLLGGFLPSWWGHRRKPVLILGTLLVLMGVVILLTGVYCSAPGSVFLAGYVVLAASSCSVPTGTTLMKELNRPETVALAVAIPNSLCYAGVAVLANAAGLILDLFASKAIVKSDHLIYPPAAYALLFWVLLALCGVSLIACFMIQEAKVIGPDATADVAKMGEPI